MNILLSNDDGFYAPGLAALTQAVEGFGEISVVAPDRNRSGASNSLTLDAPLRVMEVAARRYAVGGTPTDCVHLAISGLLKHSVDLILSGINDGANLGDDVLYSGTVAAAMEGRSLGVPSIAFSLVHNADATRHFDTAQRVVQALVTKFMQDSKSLPALLNVNIPNVPFDQLNGYKVVRLGHRHPALPTVPTTDPRGRPMYWVGGPGSGKDAGEGTDFAAIEANFVSLTPLKADLTDHSVLQGLGSLAEALS